MRGAKSFMQIEKSACNKPLTLNCEVTSNPSSNITWYRRRLNRIYVEHLRAAFEHDRRRTARLLSVDSSFATRPAQTKTSSLSLEFEATSDLVNGDLYEDEMVGTGPTYTIASFNCANLVRSSLIKNSTSSNSQNDEYNNGFVGKSQRFKRDNTNTNNKNEPNSQETLYADSIEVTTENPEDGGDNSGT